MTRPPRRRRSRPLLKAEGRFGKEKSRSRKGAGFFIYDLRLHLVDSWQMVVGSGDISPERSEPRKRSQEGCALAVVHGMGGGSRLSRPPRMGSGSESLPRVRCPHAVFARAGARPSRGNISPERSEPRKRSQQVRPSRAYGGDSIEIALPQINQAIPKFLNAIANRKSKITNEIALPFACLSQARRGPFRMRTLPASGCL